MRTVLLSLLFGTVTAVVAPAFAQSDSSSEDQAAAVIVSSQLRAQGYKCEDPHDAQPDKSDSVVGEQAWIVTCDNATYRVRLVPDQAAEVDQID